MDSEPSNFDFVTGSLDHIRKVVAINVVEPLLDRDADGNLLPLLAESYEVSDDGLVYTFSIREALFHDGTPMTAADVVYSIENNAEAPAEVVSQPLSPVVSVEAVDDRTVRVTLERPSIAFLIAMAGDSGLVYPAGSTSEDLARGPIGTGPYSFEEWRTGVDVTLSAFEDYWGERPYFDEAVYRFISDEVAAANALITGEADVSTGSAGFLIQRVTDFEADPEFQTIPISVPSVGYVSLNAASPKMQDDAVRLAINHALDRQAFDDGVYAGLATPHCTFDAPTEPWASTDYCPYEYDPAKSRQLLEESGQLGLDLTVKFGETPVWATAAEILGSQLTEAGFTVTLEGQEFGSYIDEVVGERVYELTPLGGTTNLNAWQCPGHFTQWCDPGMDALIAEADQALDFEEFVSLRRQAVQRHADAGYLIPLVLRPQISIARSELTGVKQFQTLLEFDLRGLGWSD